MPPCTCSLCPTLIKPAHSKKKYCKTCRQSWSNSNNGNAPGQDEGTWLSGVSEHAESRPFYDKKKKKNIPLKPTTDTPPPPPSPSNLPLHHLTLSPPLHQTPNCIFHILDFLEVEDALLFASVNKSWLEASRYPTLGFRQEVDWINSVYSYASSNIPPFSGSSFNISLNNFLSLCTRLRSLHLPFMSLENLKLLTERPNENLRELSFESAFIYSKSKDLSRSICEKAVFEFLSTLPPTLKELTVKNFKSSPTQNYNLWTPLTSSTCQNLTYLDISGSSAILAKPNPTSLSGYSNLAYYNNLRSIGEFLNRFNLQNLQELNIFNTSLTGTFEDVGNARTEQDVHRLRSGCRKGPLTSQHPSFSSRNFYTKPLRVNAKDGHRLRESVTLKCAICHVVIAEDVRSYMKAPPQQGHISYEILFDFVSPDCTTLPLDDLTFKSVRLRDVLPAESIPPGVSEEMLNQRQVMINCRNNCHEVKDQFLIAGQDGFMVDTRDYKYSAAVGEGLCYEAD